MRIAPGRTKDDLHKNERVCPTLKSRDADSSHGGLAGLRGVFHHPFVLADGASTRAPVAGSRGVAIQGSCPCLDHDVDRHGQPYGCLAACRHLFQWLELDCSRMLVRARHPSLFAGRSALQLGTIRRPA